MSQENIETVAHLIDQWNAGRRNLGDLAGIFDPAIELESPLSSVAGEPYRGRAGIEEWTRDVDEQFSEWRIAMGDVREVGNQVITQAGAIRGRGRASGVTVEFQSSAVVTFGSDRRITRIRLYADADEALKAVGLAE